MDTYGDLKTEVLFWLDREDTGTIASIPRHVRLVESEVYRDLRCQDNEFVARYDNTGWALDDGPLESSYPGVHLALPPNYRELSLVTWNGNPLRSISNAHLQSRLGRAIDNEPVCFSRSGRRLQFSAAMDVDPSDWLDTDVLTYTYWGTESLNSLPTWQVAYNPTENPPVEDTSPEDLTQTDDNTTRMFQRHPDLYLFGTLHYAALFLQDADAAAVYGAKYQAALASIARESKRNRLSGGTKSVQSAH